MDITTSIQHTIEQTVYAISGKAAWVGGSVAAGSGIANKAVQAVTHDPELASNVLDLSEVGIVVGIAVGVVGLAVRIVFEVRADMRAERLARDQINRRQDR